MQNIEPYFGWLKYYDGEKDEQSPFYGKEYDYDTYSNAIYSYYISPSWDSIGSETLYIKILYINYEEACVIIEFFGEWNDTLHNDVMHLKRNIIDELGLTGIKKYILIGENVMNFHGSDDCYYEEWFDDVEEGWITAIGFKEFVLEEMTKYNIDNYVNIGGQLDLINWRTIKPNILCNLIDELMQKRLSI